MSDKIATIVPKNHLHLIRENDYFMALAHVAKADLDYQAFFFDRSEEGKYVILDNSAVEEGEPGNFKDYVDTAIGIGARAIMLPDFFQDAKETVLAAYDALEYLETLELLDMEVMVIPQGRTVGEWLESALQLQSALLEYGYQPFIGISCRYTDMFGGSRHQIALTVHSSINSFAGKIHLLGCYADPRAEAWPLMGCEWFSGIDSSYPSVYASHGYDLTDERFSWPRPPRNIDFMNDKYDDELLKSNIEVWRNACKNGPQLKV